MSGLIHIYCGDGKGKTTAAVGFAVRAAGAGRKVLFTQFYKNGSSSEIAVLESIENIETMLCKTTHPLFSRMNEVEKEQARLDYSALLERVLTASENKDLLVLDEIISACNHATVDEAILIEFLKSKAENLEVVLTGREPSDDLCQLSDYISEVRKIKHPFDKGVRARKGIEF